MANTTVQLTKETEYGNTIRSLKTRNSSLPGGGEYDKISFWTLASDIKMDAGDIDNLEDYYDDITEKAAATSSQHIELISFLRDMDLGVTEYTGVSTLVERIKMLNSPIIGALEEMSGKTMSDTSLQGISSFIRSLNTELTDTLEALDITATGTEDIVDALDSLS